MNEPIQSYPIFEVRVNGQIAWTGNNYMQAECKASACYKAALPGTKVELFQNNESRRVQVKAVKTPAVLKVGAL